MTVTEGDQGSKEATFGDAIRSARNNGIAERRRKAVAYVRVSLKKQAEKGLSLDAQGAAIRQYAELYALDLVDLISDKGESAGSLKRPGMDRALSLLREGKAECLVVAKLDRLTRSVHDLGTLLREYFGSGSKHSLMVVSDQVDTSTANGRAFANLVMTLSEWERETIAERTRAAMAHKKSKGEYCGGPVPYGYRLSRNGRRLVKHEREQAVLRRVQGLRQSGISIRQIVDQLDAEGARSRVGTQFRRAQVLRMLARESK